MLRLFSAIFLSYLVLYVNPPFALGAESALEPLPQPSCRYEITLLGAARESMSMKQYKQVLAQTGGLLSCSSGLAILSMLDIHKMRAEALYCLYLESLVGKDQVESSEPDFNRLLSALREYEDIYSLIKKGESGLIARDTSVLQDELNSVVTAVYGVALEMLDRGLTEQVVEYFQVLVDVLTVVDSDKREFRNIRAQAGEYTGRFFLRQGDLKKAEENFRLAFVVDESMLTMNALELKSSIPLEPMISSQLCFNLAGIYYKKLLKVISGREINSAGELRQQVRRLAKQAEMYFLLSYRLNPNNTLAKTAASTLAGFI